MTLNTKLRTTIVVCALALGAAALLIYRVKHITMQGVA